MSEPTKPTKETKTSDSKKTVGEKKETKNEISSSNKPENTPKSASQTSISHFSSVSTPAYRSGWDNIFGKKSNSKSSVKESEDKITKEFLLSDSEINKELRQALFEAFCAKATDEGIELPKSSETHSMTFNISCTYNKN